MARLRNATTWGLVGVALAAVIVLLALLYLTRTEAGVERAGQYVVERIRGSVEGELEVERVRSRGLLRGVTLDGLRITGPDGRLFLQADSARLAYRIRTLMGGDISFHSLTLYRPEIHLELLPDRDEWNFQIIFPEDPDPVEDNIVLIEDVTLHDGFVAIRMPWEPTTPDADISRLTIEDVPGGQVRTVRFEALNGRMPRIVWQAPEVEGRSVDIATLSARAYLWDEAAEILELQGRVTMRDSVVAFRMPHVRLPDSDLSALGRVVLGADGFHYDVEVQGDRVRLRDFQWLYPALPDDGGGSLRFRVQTRERGNILWLAEDARLSAPGTELAGSFGVVTGDTLYFANVSLRASPLNLELIQRLLPMELPIEGLLIGTVEVDGPIAALRTRGDMRYRSAATGAAESAIRWSGRIRAGPKPAAHGLEVTVRALDLGQVARYAPGLRLRGVASGRVRLDGSLAAGLQMDGHLALDHDGLRSAVHGTGSILAAPGTSDLDLQFDAEPVVLTLLAQQYPALGRLAGAVDGPVRVTGSLHDLRVDADLRTPAGALYLDGHLAVDGGVPRYRARGQVAEFRLDRLLDGIPETALTGGFDVTGAHLALDSLQATVALDLIASRVAGVDVHRGRFRAAVTGGMARVDSLSLLSSVGRLAATGTFGLVPGAHGELDVRVLAESLTPLEPLLFSGPVPDDVALTGPRVAGSLFASGTITGSVSEWRAGGEVQGRELVYQGAKLSRGRADLAWDGSGFTLVATMDSLSSGQRLAPTVRTEVRYADELGSVVLYASGLGAQELELEGGFRWSDAALLLRLESLALATGEGLWGLDVPVAARLGRDGLSIDDLVLRRAASGARLRVAGVLPWRQADETATLPAAMTVDLEGASLAEVVVLGQRDLDLVGDLTVGLRLTGTALAPTLEGTVISRAFRYGDAVLDSVAGSVAYRDRLLTGMLEGWRQGKVILAADAAVPIDLALTERDTRLADRPAHIRMRAQGMPVALIAFLLPGLRQVEGVLDGVVTLGGAATGLAVGGQPMELSGELKLSRGAALVGPLNVRYRDIQATATMGEGTRVHLDARLRSDQGAAAVRGTVELARLRDPAFDLALSAQRLDASRRRDVVAIADGEVRLTGRYTEPVLSGGVRVLAGEMNLDELLRRYHIVQLDTSLFSLFDPGTLVYRVRPSNPFLANLSAAGLTVTAERNVWLRSRELNVEVAGSLDVAFDRRVNDVRLTGTMQALRGSYQLQVLERLPARRFDVRDGTVEFAGTPGLDPNIDITASARIRRAQGDPLDVMASVTGTLQRPRVRFSSESDPPVSETDIASFLLFGRSTLELSQAETDVVASMREGMLGLARPMFLGLASTQLHQAAANLGLPVDYLALTAPEYGFGDYSQVMSAHGGFGVLQGTQLEAGFYAHPDVFVLGSFTPFARALGTFAETESLFHPRWGARIEWRFRPTWTMEVYWEDRYARTPSFSFDQIHDRTAGGMSVFREWGY
jgi:translocation and assembly module TamB